MSELRSRSTMPVWKVTGAKLFVKSWIIRTELQKNIVAQTSCCPWRDFPHFLTSDESSNHELHKCDMAVHMHT